MTAIHVMNFQTFPFQIIQMKFQNKFQFEADSIIHKTIMMRQIAGNTAIFL